MGEFKVGDRVVWMGKKSDFYTPGKTYEILKSNEYFFFLTDDARGNHSWSPDALARSFTLVPAFQIEAGKFYTTRDGRKVGPMRDDWEYHGVYHFHTTKGDLSGHLWRADGQQCNNTNPEVDLVAEWTEPAVVAKVRVGATVDAISDEYGSGVAPVAQQQAKFKVGDRVRHKTLGYEGHVLEVVDAVTVKTFWPAVGWGGHDPIDELAPINPTAIVALIEDGQPKPATRPYVHTTVESAEREAKRLANIHVGQKFGVYALTGEPVLVEKAKENFTEELVIKLSLDTADFEREIARARQSLTDLEQRARRTNRRLAA